MWNEEISADLHEGFQAAIEIIHARESQQNHKIYGILMQFVKTLKELPYHDATFAMGMFFRALNSVADD